MTATGKSFWTAVCFMLVLGMVIVQATAAEPSGQKKKPPSSSTDIPLEFNFITLPYSPAPEIRADSGGEYTHGEDAIEARMGSRSGAATLETKDGPRTLLVDFWDDEEPPEGCDFGECSRPLTVPPPPDYVFVPEDSLGMFLRIGSEDLRDIAVGAEVSESLHIRINTGDRDYIYLKYYPAIDHPKSLCPILSEEDGATVYARVQRTGTNTWQVTGTTARVEEYFGNKGECHGYHNMPVSFTITILP